jgi:DNA-binding SARP family transcriptional activator
MLRIWLFGALSVACDEAGDQVQAVSGRCASLLAYLALGRGRYFSRSELLGVLWPEREQGVGPGTFNTALWRLRRMIERPPYKHGEWIASDRRGAIGLVGQGGGGVWLDTEEFERRIAPALSKPIEALSETEIEALRAGAAIYTADILPEFSDDWALREREKMRRHYLNALWRLMQIASVRRDYAESIRYAQRILDCDALREDVHRELMRLFVLGGQRAQALRQFEVCRDLLRRELAIPPMRETLTLYREIADSAVGARGDLDLSGSDSPPPAATPDLRAELRLQDALHRERGLFDPPVEAPRPLAGTGIGATREAGASAARDPTSGDAQRIIREARRHLAEADAQLELSLRVLP